MLFDKLFFFLDSKGFSKDFAALTCKELKQKLSSVVSGVYWIDPDGGSHSNAFQAYCDQLTDGGGWTLVYSYTLRAGITHTSQLHQTLSSRVHPGQPAAPTSECPKQFHWARRIMRPWTSLCGVALVRKP